MDVGSNPAQGEFSFKPKNNLILFAMFKMNEKNDDKKKSEEYINFISFTTEK